MYLALSFTDGFATKFEKKQASPDAAGPEGYSHAIRDGFAAGLKGLAEQALAAVGNEMPNHDPSIIGIAIELTLNDEGVAEVFIRMYPSRTTSPEPVFQLGPHINVMTTDPIRERLRFRTSVLNLNPLPAPGVVTAMCQAEALILGQQVARDGFPSAVKRALAEIGKAFRYVEWATSLTAKHWTEYPS
ncbi:MAG: hypothetical protein PHI63_05695 [Patescibacteria group bacterium]|nr:hypothetical protein [Patescibacteria group bacterium]